MKYERVLFTILRVIVKTNAEVEKYVVFILSECSTKIFSACG